MNPSNAESTHQPGFSGGSGESLNNSGGAILSKPGENANHGSRIIGRGGGGGNRGGGRAGGNFHSSSNRGGGGGRNGGGFWKPNFHVNSTGGGRSNNLFARGGRGGGGGGGGSGRGGRWFSGRGRGRGGARHPSNSSSYSRNSSRDRDRDRDRDRERSDRERDRDRDGGDYYRGERDRSDHRDASDYYRDRDSRKAAGGYGDRTSDRSFYGVGNSNNSNSNSNGRDMFGRDITRDSVREYRDRIDGDTINSASVKKNAINSGEALLKNLGGSVSFGPDGNNNSNAWQIDSSNIVLPTSLVSTSASNNANVSTNSVPSPPVLKNKFSSTLNSANNLEKKDDVPSILRDEANSSTAAPFSSTVGSVAAGTCRTTTNISPHVDPESDMGTSKRKGFSFSPPTQVGSSARNNSSNVDSNSTSSIHGCTNPSTSNSGNVVKWRSVDNKKSNTNFVNSQELSATTTKPSYHPHQESNTKIFTKNNSEVSQQQLSGSLFSTTRSGSSIGKRRERKKFSSTPTGTTPISSDPSVNSGQVISTISPSNNQMHLQKPNVTKSPTYPPPPAILRKPVTKSHHRREGSTSMSSQWDVAPPPPVIPLPNAASVPPVQGTSTSPEVKKDTIPASQETPNCSNIEKGTGTVSKDASHNAINIVKPTPPLLHGNDTVEKEVHRSSPLSKLPSPTIPPACKIPDTRRSISNASSSSSVTGNAGGTNVVSGRGSMTGLNSGVAKRRLGWGQGLVSNSPPPASATTPKRPRVGWGQGLMRGTSMSSLATSTITSSDHANVLSRSTSDVATSSSFPKIVEDGKEEKLHSVPEKLEGGLEPGRNTRLEDEDLDGGGEIVDMDIDSDEELIIEQERSSLCSVSATSTQSDFKRNSNIAPAPQASAAMGAAIACSTQLHLTQAQFDERKDEALPPKKEEVLASIESLDKKIATIKQDIRDIQEGKRVVTIPGMSRNSTCNENQEREIKGTGGCVPPAGVEGEEVKEEEEEEEMTIEMDPVFARILNEIVRSNHEKRQNAITILHKTNTVDSSNTMEEWWSKWRVPQLKESNANSFTRDEMVKNLIRVRYANHCGYLRGLSRKFLMAQRRWKYRIRKIEKTNRKSYKEKKKDKKGTNCFHSATCASKDASSISTDANVCGNNKLEEQPDIVLNKDDENKKKSCIDPIAATGVRSSTRFLANSSVVIPNSGGGKLDKKNATDFFLKTSNAPTCSPPASKALTNILTPSPSHSVENSCLKTSSSAIGGSTSHRRRRVLRFALADHLPNMILDEETKKYSRVMESTTLCNSIDNQDVDDPMTKEINRKFVNPWSDIEKCIYLDKFLQFPKNFYRIGCFLSRKSTGDVIEFYYKTKKLLDYKALLREQQLRRRGAAGGLKNTWSCWQLSLGAALAIGVMLPRFLVKKILNRSNFRSHQAAGNLLRLMNSKKKKKNYTGLFGRALQQQQLLQNSSSNRRKIVKATDTCELVKGDQKLSAQSPLFLDGIATPSESMKKSNEERDNALESNEHESVEVEGGLELEEMEDEEVEQSSTEPFVVNLTDYISDNCYSSGYEYSNVDMYSRYEYFSQQAIEIDRQKQQLAQEKLKEKLAADRKKEKRKKDKRKVASATVLGTTNTTPSVLATSSKKSNISANSNTNSINKATKKSPGKNRFSSMSTSTVGQSPKSRKDFNVAQKLSVSGSFQSMEKSLDDLSRVQHAEEQVTEANLSVPFVKSNKKKVKELGSCTLTMKEKKKANEGISGPASGKKPKRMKIKSEEAEKKRERKKEATKLSKLNKKLSIQENDNCKRDQGGNKTKRGSEKRQKVNSTSPTPVSSLALAAAAMTPPGTAVVGVGSVNSRLNTKDFLASHHHHQLFAQQQHHITQNRSINTQGSTQVPPPSNSPFYGLQPHQHHPSTSTTNSTVLSGNNNLVPNPAAPVNSTISGVGGGTPGSQANLLLPHHSHHPHHVAPGGSGPVVPSNNLMMRLLEKKIMLHPMASPHHMAAAVAVHNNLLGDFQQQSTSTSSTPVKPPSSSKRRMIVMESQITPSTNTGKKQKFVAPVAPGSQSVGTVSGSTTPPTSSAKLERNFAANSTTSSDSTNIGANAVPMNPLLTAALAAAAAANANAIGNKHQSSNKGRSSHPALAQQHVYSNSNNSGSAGGSSTQKAMVSSDGKVQKGGVNSKANIMDMLSNSNSTSTGKMNLVTASSTSTTTASVATPTGSSIPVPGPAKRVIQKWTDGEKADFLHYFSHYGKDWSTLCRNIPTKTPAQIKNYYQNYKNRLGLQDILKRRGERLASAAASSSLTGGSTVSNSGNIVSSTAARGNKKDELKSSATPSSVSSTTATMKGSHQSQPLNQQHLKQQREEAALIPNNSGGGGSSATSHQHHILAAQQHVGGLPPPQSHHHFDQHHQHPYQSGATKQPAVTSYGGYTGTTTATSSTSSLYNSHHNQHRHHHFESSSSGSSPPHFMNEARNSSGTNSYNNIKQKNPTNTAPGSSGMMSYPGGSQNAMHSSSGSSVYPSSHRHMSTFAFRHPPHHSPASSPPSCHPHHPLEPNSSHHPSSSTVVTTTSSGQRQLLPLRHPPPHQMQPISQSTDSGLPSSTTHSSNVTGASHHHPHHHPMFSNPNRSTSPPPTSTSNGSTSNARSTTANPHYLQHFQQHHLQHHGPSQPASSPVGTNISSSNSNNGIVSNSSSSSGTTSCTYPSSMSNLAQLSAMTNPTSTQMHLMQYHMRLMYMQHQQLQQQQQQQQFNVAGSTPAPASTSISTGTSSDSSAIIDTPQSSTISSGQSATDRSVGKKKRDPKSTTAGNSTPYLQRGVSGGSSAAIGISASRNSTQETAPSVPSSSHQPNHACPRPHSQPGTTSHDACKVFSTHPQLSPAQELVMMNMNQNETAKRMSFSSILNESQQSPIKTKNSMPVALTSGSKNDGTSNKAASSNSTSGMRHIHPLINQHDSHSMGNRASAATKVGEDLSIKGKSVDKSVNVDDSDHNNLNNSSCNSAFDEHIRLAHTRKQEAENLQKLARRAQEEAAKAAHLAKEAERALQEAHEAEAAAAATSSRDGIGPGSGPRVSQEGESSQIHTTSISYPSGTPNAPSYPKFLSHVPQQHQYEQQRHIQHHLHQQQTQQQHEEKSNKETKEL